MDSPESRPEYSRPTSAHQANQHVTASLERQHRHQNEAVFLLQKRQRHGQRLGRRLARLSPRTANSIYHQLGQGHMSTGTAGPDAPALFIVWPFSKIVSSLLYWFVDKRLIVPRRSLGWHSHLDGTFVWTGRALQAGCGDLEIIGLAHLYSAL